MLVVPNGLTTYTIDPIRRGSHGSSFGALGGVDNSNIYWCTCRCLVIADRSRDHHETPRLSRGFVLLGYLDPSSGKVGILVVAGTVNPLIHPNLFTKSSALRCVYRISILVSLCPVMGRFYRPQQQPSYRCDPHHIQEYAY